MVLPVKQLCSNNAQKSANVAQGFCWKKKLVQEEKVKFSNGPDQLEKPLCNCIELKNSSQGPLNAKLNCWYLTTRRFNNQLSFSRIASYTFDTTQVVLRRNYFPLTWWQEGYTCVGLPTHLFCKKRNNGTMETVKLAFLVNHWQR